MKVHSSICLISAAALAAGVLLLQVGVGSRAPATRKPDPAQVPAARPRVDALDPLAAPLVMPVEPTHAAQVRSVIDAHRSGQHPERLSATEGSTPFDRAAFAADPQAYLAVCEPGRCYATGADASSAGQTLSSVDASDLRVPALGEIVLRVRGSAGIPVTFTTLDGGVFENGLLSISVLADDQGIASARYRASAGVSAGVRVVAGSPLCDNPVELQIAVDEPVAAR